MKMSAASSSTNGASMAASLARAPSSRTSGLGRTVAGNPASASSASRCSASRPAPAVIGGLGGQVLAARLDRRTRRADGQLDDLIAPQTQTAPPISRFSA